MGWLWVQVPPSTPNITLDIHSPLIPSNYTPAESYIMNTINMPNLSALCTLYGIRATVTDGRYVPGECDHVASTVTLTNLSEVTIVVPYRQGIACLPRDAQKRSSEQYWLRQRLDGWKKPTAADVISALCVDAGCAKGSFSDFCANLGYEEDSRKALDLYLKCQNTASDLRRFLGQSLSEFNEAASQY